MSLWTQPAITNCSRADRGMLAFVQPRQGKSVLTLSVDGFWDRQPPTDDTQACATAAGCS
jgi:hypothetical protein